MPTQPTKQHSAEICTSLTSPPVATLRLEEQLLGMEGIESLWLGPPIPGGLRGGRISVQLEVDRSISVPQLVQSVHALDNRILALPYENRGWIWR